jgi:hypothetical protein
MAAGSKIGLVVAGGLPHATSMLARQSAGWRTQRQRALIFATAFLAPVWARRHVAWNQCTLLMRMCLVRAGAAAVGFIVYTVKRQLWFLKYSGKKLPPVRAACVPPLRSLQHGELAKRMRRGLGFTDGSLGVEGVEFRV